MDLGREHHLPERHHPVHRPQLPAARAHQHRQPDLHGPPADLPQQLPDGDMDRRGPGAQPGLPRRPQRKSHPCRAHHHRQPLDGLRLPQPVRLRPHEPERPGRILRSPELHHDLAVGRGRLPGVRRQHLHPLHGPLGHAVRGHRQRPRLPQPLHPGLGRVLPHPLPVHLGPPHLRPARLPRPLPRRLLLRLDLCLLRPDALVRVRGLRAHVSVLVRGPAMLLCTGHVQLPHARQPRLRGRARRRDRPPRGHVHMLVRLHAARRRPELLGLKWDARARVVLVRDVRPQLPPGDLGARHAHHGSLHRPQLGGHPHPRRGRAPRAPDPGGL